MNLDTIYFDYIKNKIKKYEIRVYDPKRQKVMVRSVIGEDNLLQDFWIEITWRESVWHIRPAKGCGIVPTAGIQRALDLVHGAAKSVQK